ncbi:unnamed protein product [Protopolystoma xenopodis]|uniref:Fibronectin type-III domain-containing protein n=1 Tax=Protopolystoma xenopodis TaxID=117903 RepID=A0A3S5A8A0_9PLAT|nr:unnamed protein product [Protopolystoma xenopodis]
MLSPTALEVSWRAAKERYEELRYYKLTWQPAMKEGRRTSSGEMEEPVSTSILFDKAGERSKNVPVDETNPTKLYVVPISDLQPDVTYQVSVAAANPQGVGPAYRFPIVKTTSDGFAGSGRRGIF